MQAYNRQNVLVAVYDVGAPEKATHYGVVKLEGNRIVELEEKPAQPKSSLVATACYILPPRIFPVISEYCKGAKRDNLGSFISHLVERDLVLAFPFSETWIDIGNLEIYHSTK
jgi:glucose-1-phosphate thymidylyltransferase